MIESIDIERLRGIGFAPSLLQPLAAMLADFPQATPMRVIELQREGLALHDGTQELAARVLPALRHALDDEGDALACGDWVLAERNGFGEWWAVARLPPVNQLARRLHDGRDKVTRTVIVSNVDTALIVMGLDMDYNLRRLERYAVRCGGGHNHRNDLGAGVLIKENHIRCAGAARQRAIPEITGVRGRLLSLWGKEAHE